MLAYSYAQANSNFSEILKAAIKDDVIITLGDGNRFKLTLLRGANVPKTSPLDVPGIHANVKLNDIMEAVHEGRSIS